MPAVTQFRHKALRGLIDEPLKNDEAYLVPTRDPELGLQRTTGATDAKRDVTRYTSPARIQVAQLAREELPGFLYLGFHRRLVPADLIEGLAYGGSVETPRGGGEAFGKSLPDSNPGKCSKMPCTPQISSVT